MHNQIFIEISREVASVLGFSEAGWPSFCEELHANGMQVITSATPLLTAEQSLYEKHHGQEVIHSKANRPRKSPEDIANTIAIVKEQLLNLKEQASRQAILTYILIDVMMEYDLSNSDQESQFHNLHKQIASHPNPNHELLSYLIQKTNDFDKQLNNEALVGYSMLNMLRESKQVHNFLQERDQETATLLINSLNEVNLDCKGYTNQVPITNCKKLIVDTLQVNLIRLANGEPLMQIKVIIGAEDNSNVTIFSPNWHTTAKKHDYGRTNVELRVLFKLTKELDHPLINMLMEHTTQFYQKVGSRVIETTAPWEENAQLWQERTRTANKPPHFCRTTQQTQDWIKEIYALADTTIDRLSLTRDCMLIRNDLENTQSNCDVSLS